MLALVKLYGQMPFLVNQNENWSFNEKDPFLGTFPSLSERHVGSCVPSD